MKKLLSLYLTLTLVAQTMTASKPSDHVLPPFDKAMYTAPEYKQAYEHILNNKPEASFVKKLVENYTRWITEWPWQDTVKIPKIIHQIWVGPKELPIHFYEWQQTWLSMHPDWEYRLWRDQDIAALGLTNQKFYNATTSYGEKANIARYEILYRFGGVYLDTDFECIKSLYFLHHTCDFYAGLEFPQPNKDFLIVGNAIIGARAGHSLIKMFIDQMKHHWHHSWQPKRSGTFFVTNIIKKNIHKYPDATIIFPSNFFYPWINTQKPWEHRDESYRDINCPESIGFHHWDLSWQKKRS